MHRAAVIAFAHGYGQFYYFKAEHAQAYQSFNMKVQKRTPDNCITGMCSQSLESRRGIINSLS